MTINPIITRQSQIANEIFSSIAKFTLDKPFENQRSVSFRNVGKMKPLFMLGPHRDSKVVTIGDTWNLGGTLNMDSVRNNLIEKGLYGMFSYIPGEGGTVWGVTPDEQWASKEGVLEMDAIIKKDIQGRRWMSAFSSGGKALAKLQKQNVLKRLLTASPDPFALSFISSVTLQIMPFFGRCQFSAALDNGVVSVVQIPLMNDNKDSYFAWNFALNNPDDYTESDFDNEFPGGGENDYELFKKLREFTQKECQPLNQQGNYNQTTHEEIESSDNDTPTNNPLLRAARGESLYRALEKLHITLEADTRKGKPYQNKLPMEAGIPTLGPLY